MSGLINKSMNSFSLAGFAGVFCRAGLLLMMLVALAAVESKNTFAYSSPATLIQNQEDESSVPEKFKSFSEPVGKTPDWVTRGSFLDEDAQAEFVVVKSDELLKQREAKQELQERVIQAVRDKVDDLFGYGAGDAVSVDLPYVQDNLLQILDECKSDGVYTQQRSWPVSAENLDKLETSVRDAFQCYACIRFDSEFESWAKSEWENRLVSSRTMQVGLWALTLMTLMGLLFVYCTAEHKTRGFYSRRLQTAGLGFLLFAGAVFWWLSTQFAWL